jgi:hypothetical protein
MINENLITYNSSFQEGTTDVGMGNPGWSMYVSGTLSKITTDSFSGGSCLKIVKTSTSSNSGVSIAEAYRPSITLSAVYSASAYIKVPTGQESVLMVVEITYYNGTTPVNSVNSSGVTISSADGWVRVNLDAKTAPSSGVTKIGVTIYDAMPTKTVGKHYLVDAVKLENSYASTQYIDPLDLNQESAATRKSLTPLFPGDIDSKQYINGLQLQSDISFNGLVLNTIDENGVVWVCTDIENWWNLPESEVPDIARGLDDGSYDVRGRWRARTVNLRGSILPPRPELAPAARKKLIETAALVYSGGWLLVNESPVKGAYVRLVGQPVLESVNPRGRIDFTIPLRAGDPVKYSWNVNDSAGLSSSAIATTDLNTTTGATTITNAGNTNVAASIKLTAPLTAPAYITNQTTGDQIKVIKNLRSAGFNNSTTALGFSRTSGINTITMSGSHGLIVGDVVTIGSMASGNAGITMNGNRTITAATDTTLSYVETTIPIASANISSGVVTVTHAVASPHGLVTNDVAYIAGLGAPFDGTYTVTRVSDTVYTYNRASYTGTATAYAGTLSPNEVYTVDAGGDGTVALTNADTLEIDTYNTTVLYRGLPDSARSTVDVDIDWIKLIPGSNKLLVQTASGTPTATIKYRSGWIG